MKSVDRTKVLFLGIVLTTVIATSIALPKSLPISFSAFGHDVSYTIGSPVINFSFFGRPVYKEFEFKQGLDIQGGMQVVLEADMSQIDALDRPDALTSAKEIISRRVDLYGIAEPQVQTSVNDNSYRINVELPGLSNSADALALVGQTAQLEFGLFEQVDLEENPEASLSGGVTIVPTGLTGQMLKKSSVQFDQNTGEPLVALQFDAEGSKLFGEITSDHVGEPMGIFIDGSMIMAPVIQTPILTGEATITGGFTPEEAEQLSVQLNAGALPVPISVLELRTLGASLGEESVKNSIQAGVVGIGLVMLFMILYYGAQGVVASVALAIYAVVTLALYKIIGVTLTLPGIAGLLLSIGMAVDANILIFERMKEELRKAKPFTVAMETGFGKAWDSIKDANIITIFTALVLINPMDFAFLNRSGLVRGFGITLLIGVLLGLFTGVIVTRTLMRLFITEKMTVKKSGGAK
ncbi:MAG: protein translocase subunit SecD [Pseudomonadales bacterium]|nr:protein translocase subunit SecD [Pseudomonadales bacterium]